MQYLLLFASLILFTGIMFLVHRFLPKKEHLIIERILIIVFIAIFLVRYFSIRDIQSFTFGIGESGNPLFNKLDISFQRFDIYREVAIKNGFKPKDYTDLIALVSDPANSLIFNNVDVQSAETILGKFSSIVGEICIWLEVTAAIFIFLRPFANFKTAKWYVKFIATPILILCAAFVRPMFIMLQGLQFKNIVYYMLPIEIGALLSMCIYYWAKDYKSSISKHSIPEVAVFSVLINIATIPLYLPSFFFGQGKENAYPLDFSIQHRLFIYILLILIPLGIYFSLRNATLDKRIYSLRFIAIATFLSYFTFTKGFELLLPWNYPLHLCNLAMVLILICYLFLPKRLFYFTYFINVFGAILAMLMPNYSETAKVFSTSVLQFWYNHAMAFSMPLLGVALHIYERPKLKQYFISSIWFLLYYMIVFVVNPLLTAYEGTSFVALGRTYTVSGTDFFFINSLFIADKLGNWAKAIFNMSFNISLNGKEFVIHPLYQVIYFVTYFLVGFGVWFIYLLFFDISDSHYQLHLKLKGIRADRIALESQLSGRSIDEPMDKDAGIILKLNHFSKRYGLSQVYAVNDASFEVHGGEVFGFLGPNGAGKSTIIKSIVGIQPITEGDISVCGYDVKTQGVGAKSLIGFVPDHYALYEKLTGREYLNYIADIYLVSQEDRDARLAEYIKIFELEGAIDNKIKTYSHGMKQKITIISALIHDPKVWILDEPLTGLDPTSIFQVKECMKKHAEKGNIVFFSSHLIDIVEKLCDRIAIIKKGQIQTISTVEDIEKKGTSLEQFYLDTIGDTTTKSSK